MTRFIVAVLPFLFASAVAAQEASADRLKALEDRIRALETSQAAPAKAGAAAFNPAVGVALDLAYRHEHDGQGNLLFRAAELNVQAPIDPFAKGWVIVNGKSDAVRVEEAAVQTTALPWGLTLTGGRQFASFGRLAHFHDHELPVVDRPRSLDVMIGGEAQGDGLEAGYLVPAPFYLTASAGVFNKLGADNARTTNAAGRPLDHFTYLARLAASAEPGADHTIDLGVSAAWTPKRVVSEDVAATGSAVPAVVTRGDTSRMLTGLDVTYRWHPAQGGLYKGIVWGTEIMVNDERRFHATTRLPTRRERARGGFSYVQAKLGRRFRTGVMLDLSEDLDDRARLTRTQTAFLTCDVTEYQRVRLAYSRARDNFGGRAQNRVGLQWTAVLGSHVHGFRDR